MNKELQDKIYQAYPKIFIEKDLPMSQTCMCWGLEVNDGWFELIDTLCNKLQEYCDKMGIQVIATQVKEKFGELRFYYDLRHTTDISSLDLSKQIHSEINKMINDACSKSAEVCETCGKPSKLCSVNGWLYCICEECKEKLLEKRKKEKLDFEATQSKSDT